ADRPVVPPRTTGLRSRPRTGRSRPALYRACRPPFPHRCAQKAMRDAHCITLCRASTLAAEPRQGLLIGAWYSRGVGMLVKCAAARKRQWTVTKLVEYCVSKNVWTGREADRDYYDGLFDTEAHPAVGVFRVSKKRADTVGQPSAKF